jgi:hypothetical protein
LNLFEGESKRCGSSTCHPLVVADDLDGTRDPLVFHRDDDDDDDDDNNPIGVIFFSFQNKITRRSIPPPVARKRQRPFEEAEILVVSSNLNFGALAPLVSLLLSSSALCVCARVTFANRDRSGLVGRLVLCIFFRSSARRRESFGGNKIIGPA